MSAAVLKIHNENNSDIYQELKSLFSSLRLKLGSATLGKFNDYDLKNTPVVYIKNRTGEPFCIVSQAVAGVLLGNVALREIPMTLSCFRSAARSISPILKCGAIDAIRVIYFNKDLAVAVDATVLLERMKRSR